MRITGFNLVGLNAAGKHAEIEEFYTSFLGLNNIERQGAATMVNGFWFGVEKDLVHVVTDPAEGNLSMPGDTHVSLLVDDIDEAVAKIKELTADHLLVGEGSSQIIWFKDPAGNTLEFQQDPTIQCS